MLMARPNLPAEMFNSAQAVYFASERAASLTRQLLMFSGSAGLTSWALSSPG